MGAENLESTEIRSPEVQSVAVAISNSLCRWRKKLKKLAFRLHIQDDTKKGTFEKPNKNWRNPRKKFIGRNWTTTTCLLRDSNPNYQFWKLCPVDGVLLHVCILSLPLSISKFPVLLCHSVCVACSAESDGVAFCRACNTHRVTQKNGKFEIRSGSERMHTWRRTPSTGRNFQTLIIWITVS